MLLLSTSRFTSPLTSLKLANLWLLVALERFTFPRNLEKFDSDCVHRDETAMQMGHLAMSHHWMARTTTRQLPMSLERGNHETGVRLLSLCSSTVDAAPNKKIVDMFHESTDAVGPVALYGQTTMVFVRPKLARDARASRAHPAAKSAADGRPGKVDETHEQEKKGSATAIVKENKRAQR